MRPRHGSESATRIPIAALGSDGLPAWTPESDPNWIISFKGSVPGFSAPSAAPPRRTGKRPSICATMVSAMAESNEIWAEAVRTLESDRPFALATVINVRGSTPREIGAKMIVRTDGQAGTIGGGCGEAEVFRKARLLLEEGAGARLAEVDLTGDFDQQQIGTC